MAEWLVGTVGWVVGVSVAIAALSYLLIPVLIKYQQHLRAGPGYVPVDRDQLPFDVMDFMDRAVWDLRALGYEPAALVREVGGAPGVTTYLLMTYNAALVDGAAVVFNVGEAGLSTLRTPTLMFETKFDDGGTVVTGNFADAGVHPPNPKVDSLNIPGLGDVRTLWEIHRRRRQRFAPPGARPVLPPPGREVETQIEEDLRDKERCRAAGYYFLDEAAGKYRPTWKGAYLMTWKLMFPVGALRRRAKRSRARRQLRELGLDPRLLDAPPAYQPYPAGPPAFPAAAPPTGPVPVAPVVSANPATPPPIPPPVPQRPIT